jgi:CO/xanthine dehydrogenase FAD-binding subunit
MYDFEFTKPGTIAEAARRWQAEGAQALGGGQTLLADDEAAAGGAGGSGEPFAASPR